MTVTWDEEMTMDLRSAQQLAWDLAMPKGEEWVMLDHALGRVLAQPLVAAVDLPAEPRSRLDGYALRSSDVTGVSAEIPRELRLAAGCSAAGHSIEHALAAGECLRILTGAPLPVMADAVVAQEDADLHGSALTLRQPVSAGQWIMPQGADVRAGEPVFTTGTVLTPSSLAMAAALGYAGLRVHRRPSVALLATGDELMELGEPRPGPHSYCNNRHLLAWMVRLQGGSSKHLGVAGDDPTEIAGRLAEADADLVITTGGIGHGDRDFILQAWENLGVTVHFRQIYLSPGRHSAFGSINRRLFCALPGNPWAAQVVFGEIVAPILRRWQGLALPEPVAVPARLASPIQNQSGLHRAIRGALNNREGTWYFQPTRSQKVSMFAQLAASPAYALIPPEIEEMSAGNIVRVGVFTLPLLSVALFEESLVGPAVD
jgi:molybdenum cofactor synthesis domain-containing protein